MTKLELTDKEIRKIGHSRYMESYSWKKVTLMACGLPCILVGITWGNIPGLLLMAVGFGLLLRFSWTMKTAVKEGKEFLKQIKESND